MNSTTKLQLKLESLPKDAKILDAGGWFKPFDYATHVVDLMPWETRRAKLQLEQLPHERFTKETWYQINFLEENLKLPFDNKSFDFSFCSHTLEDLKQPLYLIQELMRVSKAGYIEVPSRLAEQTVAIEDGCSSKLGYFHHHYIVDEGDNNTLIFYSKENSLNINPQTCAIPLLTYRRLTAKNPNLSIISFFWEDNFSVKFESGNTAYDKARKYRNSLNIPQTEILQNNLLLIGRKLRTTLSKKYQKPTDDWWNEIIKISQPYSKIHI
ncbi:hypothetical protein BCD64_07275 [Nostoc sp. MBR 210]|nr:hypothetical protein BCD64_07275 [Nostoc sp. MBR 210]